jgi:hypothetical protein
MMQSESTNPAVRANSRCPTGTLSRKKVSDALAVLGSILPDWRGAAGHRNEVDPIRHLIVAATGWGLNPDKDAIYLNVTPSRNDGATIYKLNVKDVPVDGFWSVSLYNADGYYEKNPYDAYSLNNVTSKKNPDGSVTFGSMLAKMNRSNFFLVRPSKPVFRNQTRHSDLAKVPVENWIGYLSAYIIFGLEHRCLGKNLFDPRKTFFNIIGEKATRQHENVCCS